MRKRKNQEKLDVLEFLKENLFDLLVIEEVDEVKNAFGGSKPKHIPRMEPAMDDISTSSFAELESQIFEV